jgi:hypothetical protein
VTRKLWLLAVLLVCSASASTGAQKKTAALNPGNGTMYVGTYAGNILILDEGSEKVVGEIKLKTGIPRSLSLSEDRTKFVVLDSTLQQVEIVDIASRSTIDSFTLSDVNKRVRIRGMAVDPLSRFVILLTRTATKMIDRWDIGPSTMLQYDLKAHKVMRTIPWPKGEEREFMSVRFSPDGKLMYFFGEDVLIYDTTDFHEVDTWEVSKPVEFGAGRLDFGSTDDFNEERGFFTGVFYMQDPVQKRRLMGIGRVNLAAKEIDFFTLGPAHIGRYEFWTVDLPGRKIDSRVEFRGRPRMDISVSTSGKLLYVWQAGNTIDLYDASNYKYQRTITLDADTTTRLFVIPPRGPSRTTDQ